MANKKIKNSRGEVFETGVAERISSDFDKKYDIRDTLTVRMICNMTGCKDDSVRSALLLAIKKAGSNSANVKIRFTMKFAEDHLDELVDLAKTIQLENEARIYEIRSKLSEEDRSKGKKIAIQNYALMRLRSKVPSTVNDSTLNLAMVKTGDWYSPDNAVFNLRLDFAGLSSKKSGLNMEKEIDVTANDGRSDKAYRVITELGGMKSCPITESNKNEMSDMLYDILASYDSHFRNVDGSNMDQLLSAFKEFCTDYRKHDNTTLIDTKLSETEKRQAEDWAIAAQEWLIEN